MGCGVLLGKYRLRGSCSHCSARTLFHDQARQRSLRYSHITASPALRWEGGTRGRCLRRSAALARGPARPPPPPAVCGPGRRPGPAAALDEIDAAYLAPRRYRRPAPRAPRPRAGRNRRPAPEPQNPRPPWRLIPSYLSGFPAAYLCACSFGSLHGAQRRSSTYVRRTARRR